MPTLHLYHFYLKMSDYFMSASEEEDILNFLLDGNQHDIQNNSPFPTSHENNEEKNRTDIILPSDNKDSNNQMNHDLEHNINGKNEPHKKPKHYHKRKSILSDQAQNFKDAYYLVFTKKKKFPKPIIWEIHKLIQEPLHLMKINRDIIRDNDKYFETFSYNLTSIIQYLQIHKDHIISSIPQLKKYI